MADFFQKLPLEMQHHIFSFMDYQGLIMLSRANRHFHEVVKPERQPEEDKAGFIMIAQAYVRHNLCSTIPDWFRPGKFMLLWATNDYACYSCYRVLPMEAFSTKQIREKHAKSSPMEGADGFKRICIDCSIANGLYRSRTLIAVPKFMRAWSDMAHLKPEIDSTPMFYCGVCKVLKPRDKTKDSCICDTCGDRSTSDKITNTVYVEGKRSIACQQCGETTPCFTERGCLFCKGPVCRNCGFDLAVIGEWWCGTDCSREGYELCCRAMQENWPIRLRLAEIIQHKRAERSCVKVEEIFDDDTDDFPNYSTHSSIDDGMDG